MLQYRDRDLYVGGHGIATLTETCGSPFFLIDEMKLVDNYTALCEGLRSEYQDAVVRYCIKTNNELGVLQAISALGSHAMAACPAEVQLARQAKFTPDKVAYQSPLLRTDDIHAVLDEGVVHFHAFRMEDLDLLDGIARERELSVHISLRIHYETSGKWFSPLGFLSSRLGFSERDAMPAVVRCLNSENLVVRGINFYLGTQRPDVSSYRTPLARMVSLASDVQRRHGVQIGEINTGGGIPSSTMRRMHLTPRAMWHRWRDTGSVSDNPDRLYEFAQQLSILYLDSCQTAGIEPPTLVVESGRAIAGNATVLVTRVGQVEGNWIFLDASRNDLGESPLLFRRVILPAHYRENVSNRFYHLSGRTLNTRDVVDYRRSLPEVAPDDLLVICDAGAYTISRATRYAGLAPPVYMISSSRDIRRIRRPEVVSDLTAPMEDTHA